MMRMPAITPGTSSTQSSISVPRERIMLLNISTFLMPTFVLSHPPNSSPKIGPKSSKVDKMYCVLDSH